MVVGDDVGDGVDATSVRPGNMGTRLPPQREALIKIASWNVNSIRARLGHVTGWLKEHEPDVLLLQELKGTEFPSEIFKDLGYESAAVTQKAYNGVAVLSRLPFKTISTTLAGDEADGHARFLEVTIGGAKSSSGEEVSAGGPGSVNVGSGEMLTIGGAENERADDAEVLVIGGPARLGGGFESGGLRVVNIYLPNGNPVGTEKFDYKLAWMDRLLERMKWWMLEGTPVVIGGDFNVIPEDIDCHKPASWVRDALFQPEPRARYRAMLELGYVDAFRSLHPGEGGLFTFWDYFRLAFEHNRGIRIDHFLLSPAVAGRLVGCEIDKAPRGLEKPSDHTPIMVELR